ncbi:MAG: endonuclease NucS [Atribacterota bacterium]|nr:endonuclease NucS [Atribacterota bacterium]
MAIFKINMRKAEKLKIKKFKNEKQLQKVFEDNLEEILGIRFLASEYATTHGGRIDTLGLDEDGSSVIIEYKESEKDNVINQGLFYLDWLVDHKGDFEILVQKKLGKNVKVNWDAPRLILIAQSYNEYDKYAVNRISENIELKKYILYDNDILFIENVVLPNRKITAKKIKKTNISYKEYSVEDHLRGKPDKVKELFNELQERILKLDEKIKEKVLKLYVAYGLDKNFVEIIIQANGLWVHVDISKEEVTDPENKLIDLSEKGHWATGASRSRVDKIEDIDYCMGIIKQSYESKL